MSVVISLTLYPTDIFQKFSSHLAQTILDLHYRDRLFLGVGVGMEIIAIYSETPEVHIGAECSIFLC